MRILTGFMTVLFMAITLISQNALAWGERGHHMICQVATRLVKEEGLQNFMLNRGDIMGHVCNLPDIEWRSLPDPVAKTGDAAHFLNPENAGTTALDASLDLATYLGGSLQKGTTQAEADEAGTIWWRTLQLYNRAVQQGSLAKNSPLPTGQDTQNNDLPFNQGVYGYLANLGLMGHFVGDASQPYHNSSDYDGWQSGHGGIHAFYETECVGFYDLDLITDVEAQAKIQMNNLTSTTNVLERMKLVSSTSAAEKSQIEQLDQVKSPSVNGNQMNSFPLALMALKKPAVRGTKAEACPAFRNLIVTELARSAANLAALWDQSYREAGSLQLSAYRSYRYPLTVDFVTLDYLNSVMPISALRVPDVNRQSLRVHVEVHGARSAALQ